MSLMAAEAREAPEAVARFLERNAAGLAELGARLRRSGPPVVLTSARGSSDHAAGYFKYLCEIVLGIPCASVGASVVSVYGARIRADSALCLTISQSGQSPDILALQQAAKVSGAVSVAIVNDGTSPAARNADICLALHAGREQSVAATKSFITSCAAGAAIVAHWSGDQRLLDAIARLPQTLAEAAALSWDGFTDFARDAESLYVLGRGPGFPIAEETALKLKETCAIHAEAYSVAEVMHGPWEIMEPGFPVLVYAPDDAARETTREAIGKMHRAGADLRIVGDGLPLAESGHPLLDPLAIIQTAYLEIEQLAVALGRDPDRPRLLKKVTETI